MVFQMHHILRWDEKSTEFTHPLALVTGEIQTSYNTLSFYSYTENRTCMRRVKPHPNQKHFPTILHFSYNDEQCILLKSIVIISNAKKIDDIHFVCIQISVTIPLCCGLRSMMRESTWKTSFQFDSIFIFVLFDFSVFPFWKSYYKICTYDRDT